MALRYEIKDAEYPTWRGMRFSTLERAKRQLAQSEGSSGRWQLIDHTTRKVIATN